VQEVASSPRHFTPGDRIPGTQWIGDWVGTRAIVDAIKKKKNILSFPGIQLQFLGHPAHKFVTVLFLSRNKKKATITEQGDHV
jgi:hypothetical protein